MITHRSEVRSTVRLQGNGLAVVGGEHNRPQNGCPDSFLILMSHTILISAPSNKPPQVNRRPMNKLHLRNRQRSGSCTGHKTFRRVHLAAN